MTLGDFEILPGIVIIADDPLNQGRVKACAPGLFDNNTMTTEDMLWINPFMMTGEQTYSKLKLNSKIWILHNKNNYFEYWYIPMFEFDENSPIVNDNDADILLARSINGELVQVYYSREDGIRIINGDASVNILPSGDIKINNKSTFIDCNNSGVISLGKTGEELYSAVKGEELLSTLNTLAADINALATALNSSIMLNSNVSKSAWNAAINLKNNTNKILSEFVKIT